MKKRKTAMVIIWMLFAMSGQVFALATVCPMESMTLQKNDSVNMDMSGTKISHTTPVYELSESMGSTESKKNMQSGLDCLCDQLCISCFIYVSLLQNTGELAIQLKESPLLDNHTQFLQPSPSENPFRPPIIA